MKFGSSSVPLTNDEHSMIFSNHFGINFLPKGAGSAPSNDYGMIFTCAVQTASAFIFAMLACIVPLPWSLLCWAVVAVIIFFRVVTVLIFLAAVLRGRYTKDFYRSSFFFWGWWPMSLLLSVFAFTVFGTLVGSYLWSDLLSPYWELKKLQRYKDVNPQNIPGQRVQDAGLVDFTEFTEMDRAKGGCFMSKGNTYCVAPIVSGGEVKYGLAGMPKTGSYDYFAVGINCCSCPNRDFQCGDWQNPMASGGIRSLDYKSRPYYTLALDDWQASYGKTSKQPLFFEWVEGPEWKWKGMWNRALQIGWMAAALGLSMGLCFGFLLDKILQILWQRDIVAPRACFAPCPGMELPTMWLLPKMYYRYQQEQQEIACMPVSAQWRDQRGPGSAADDRQVAQDYGATNNMGRSALDHVFAPPGATNTSMSPGMATMGLY